MPASAREPQASQAGEQQAEVLRHSEEERSLAADECPGDRHDEDIARERLGKEREHADGEDRRRARQPEGRQLGKLPAEQE